MLKVRFDKAPECLASVVIPAFVCLAERVHTHRSHRIRPKRASHRIRPGQGSKAAVRQPTRPRQAVSKAQGNTPKVIRRMSLQFSQFSQFSQLSVPQGAKHGLARESEAWIGQRELFIHRVSAIIII